MSDPKIQVRGLYKVFDDRPEEALAMLRAGKTKDEVLAKTGRVVGVNNVSFNVEAGEIYVLMGLSGSGKSTLIRLINRLVEPSAGQIIVDGVDIASLPQPELVKWRRGRIAMVFQSFALMPHRSVIDNVSFGLEIGGKDRAARDERAMQVLKQVGLETFARKYPSQLSGGMQQRVGLARALAVNPDILLMDEAFSALDPLKRNEMQDLMLDLQRAEQRTIFFVSHDLEEALKIGTRIAIMEGGNLAQEGTPHEIITKPANDYVRRFFKGIDTTRYLTAADLLDPQVAVHSLNGGPRIASGTRLPDAMQTVLGQDGPISVFDETDHCLGGITHKSVLGRIAQGARNG